MEKIDKYRTFCDKEFDEGIDPKKLLSLANEEYDKAIRLGGKLLIIELRSYPVTTEVGYTEETYPPSLCIYGYSLETDEEFEERKKKAEKVENDKKEREKKQRDAEYKAYLTLKKKYEGEK